ncbi:MAG TPA: alpha/beta fold hydrolase, partial [Minicystis sp.]|nr:alpha/beta fold hydrolase [Minicystis sp.]
MRGAAAFEARTDDGVVLRGDVVLPEAPPRAVAVLAHAMMVTRRVMDRPSGAGLASALASRGLAVVNADLRGHGESGPRADEGATYAYDDFVTRDVTALVAAARARFPGLPVAVVGHSLGGHAAAIAAGLDPANAPDAIVALAANLWLPKLEPSRARRVLKRSMFAGWLRLAERKGYFDPRPLKLGNNPEPLAYIRQFVRMFEEDHITSADGRVDYEAALARARVPLL